MRSLTAVLHGYSGVGKSWIADTVPAPRLVLDAEGGADFTPSGPKIFWDPAREEPPKPGAGRLDETSPDVSAVDWVTCIVRVRDFGTVQRVFAWLNSGAHCFESVVFDSLTEIQKRILDQVTGTNSPQVQDWGTVLRYAEGMVREFRDLKVHPVRPLRMVVFICLSSERGEEGATMIEPHVQGQLRTTLGGLVDVMGYVYTQPAEDGTITRKMLIQPYGRFRAKDRTDILTRTFGAVVDEANLNLERMLQALQAA